MTMYDNTHDRKSTAEIDVSDDCLELIKFFEGMKLRAYQDSGGVWTIGIGHTATAKPGMIITEEQALDLLRGDLKISKNVIRHMVDVELTQYEYDALISFVFNLGGGNFQESTLRTLVNSQQHQKVPDELSKWVYQGDNKLNGLIRRRLAEGLMYSGKDWKDFDELYRHL